MADLAASPVRSLQLFRSIVSDLWVSPHVAAGEPLPRLPRATACAKNRALSSFSTTCRALPEEVVRTAETEDGPPAPLVVATSRGVENDIPQPEGQRSADASYGFEQARVTFEVAHRIPTARVCGELAGGSTCTTHNHRQPYF